MIPCENCSVLGQYPFECPECNSNKRSHRTDYEIWGDVLYIDFYCWDCNVHYTKRIEKKEKGLYGKKVDELLAKMY